MVFFFVFLIVLWSVVTCVGMVRCVGTGFVLRMWMCCRILLSFVSVMFGFMWMSVLVVI